MCGVQLPDSRKGDYGRSDLSARKVARIVPPSIVVGDSIALRIQLRQVFKLDFDYKLKVAYE